MKSTYEALCAKEEIAFRGHPMVRAEHRTTVEITTEGHLTPRGDCIVGVGASKGLADLSTEVKKSLGSEGARARLTLITPAGEFSFSARGSKDLTFESETDIVIRKSSFVCGRTLAVLSDSSARDIPRALVGSLKSPDGAGRLRIEVFL